MQDADSSITSAAGLQCAPGVPGVTPGCLGHTNHDVSRTAEQGLEGPIIQYEHSLSASAEGLQQEVHFLITEGCTAVHHEKVKRTSEIYMKAKWAAAAAQPGTERKHFCEAMMQANLVWASDAPENFRKYLLKCRRTRSETIVVTMRPSSDLLNQSFFRNQTKPQLQLRPQPPGNSNSPLSWRAKRTYGPS